LTAVDCNSHRVAKG